MHNTAELLDEDEFQDEALPNVGTGLSSDDEDDKGEIEDRDTDEESFHDGPRDLVAAFFSDVSQVDLLTRDEEEALGGRIAFHRTRILGLLRRRPRLVAEALAGAGRGVVRPEDDFREREALMVLTHVRRRLSATPRRARGRKTLAKFVEDLGKELTRYRSLRDRMMTANVRLVMTLARRYHHPTLSYLDLVQEGVLGLMRAVEKYEPSRGIKFSTYAVWWIWQQISRAADCQGAMIRTPVHWNQMRRKLGRTTAPPEGDEDRDRTDVVAQEHGVSPERIALMAQSFHCISLAAPLGDGDERTVADTLAAEDESDPELAVAGANLSERIASAVDELPDREAQILRLRFGLNGGQTFTLEEIGERFGVSRERIRQLEARALKQMKVICDAHGLADALQ